MARRPRRRWLLATAAVATAASALALAVAPGRARADSSPLLGWTAQADANVVDIVVDDANGLSGEHPVDEIDIPEDSSDFETGPYGQALASVVWPGSTAGNLGSLSGELGLPAQLEPLAAKANDTIKAEAFYPAGPQTSTYPSASTPPGVAEMKASTTDSGSTATSDLTDLSLAGVVEVKGIYGTSDSTASSSATATADSSFSEVSLLGGLITIGATTSTATATSTGSSVTGSGITHLGVITIAGQQVSVGSDGLTVGPASTTLLGSLTAGAQGEVQSAISTLGLTVEPLPETATSSGAVESITSGGLKIGLTLPASGDLNITCPTLPSPLSQLSVLCTLPGLLQGASLTITIGRSTATAVATPAFAGGTVGSTPATPSGQTAAAVSPASGAGAAPDLSGAVGATPTGSTGSLGSSAPLASGSATTNPGHSVSPSELAAVPVSLSSPVKAGTVLGMLLLALLLAAGAIGLGSRVDGPVLSECPHGEDPPIREETP